MVMLLAAGFHLITFKLFPAVAAHAQVQGASAQLVHSQGVQIQTAGNILSARRVFSTHCVRTYTHDHPRARTTLRHGTPPQQLLRGAPPLYTASPLPLFYTIQRHFTLYKFNPLGR